MSVKSKRMTLATGSGRRIRVRGKGHSLSSINNLLSRQVDTQKVLDNYPVLEIKDGIAVNMDYTNPQHLKWLED